MDYIKNLGACEASSALVRQVRFARWTLCGLCAATYLDLGAQIEALSAYMSTKQGEGAYHLCDVQAHSNLAADNGGVSIFAQIPGICYQALSSELAPASEAKQAPAPLGNTSWRSNLSLVSFAGFILFLAAIIAV
jgi:hypothetical protein